MKNIFENFMFREQKLKKEKSQPYVIAEIGVNHEGSIEKALELIELAASAGADAAKFQTYKAEKLAATDSPSYWDLEKEPIKSQRELFKKYDNFGAKEYQLLEKHCRLHNIEFCSTPFDEEAIDFLDPLMKFYKVASADITNVPLLIKIASKKKTRFALYRSKCSLGNSERCKSARTKWC